jgi:hypothetical protein
LRVLEAELLCDGERLLELLDAVGAQFLGFRAQGLQLACKFATPAFVRLLEASDLILRGASGVDLGLLKVCAQL